MKLCSKCNEFKDIGEFNKNQCWCRSCYAEYNRYYREVNADYYSAYGKSYRESLKGNYIYVIKEHGDYMYLGSSQNLRYRVMYGHLNLSSNISSYIKENRWTSIEYIELDQELSREDLYFIEHIIISELCPKLNKQHNYSLTDIQREEELTDLAFNILDHLEDLLITYKINDNVVEYEE